jgi:hypothetical protein
MKGTLAVLALLVRVVVRPAPGERRVMRPDCIVG